MTKKTSATQQNILDAGGQDSLKLGLKTCTVTGKNCAVPSLRRDTFSAKVPGFVPALTSGNAYSLNRRAVSCKGNLHRTLTIPGFPTRKQEFLQPVPVGIPSLQNTCFFAYARRLTKTLVKKPGLCAPAVINNIFFDRET